MVPDVVRLKQAGACACGALVAAGERAGYARHHQRVVCLDCLAALSAGSGSVASDPDEPYRIYWDVLDSSSAPVEPTPSLVYSDSGRVRADPFGTVSGSFDSAPSSNPLDPRHGEPAAPAHRGVRESETRSGSTALRQEVVPYHLPEPFAVIIPADWAPPTPIALPSWQRAAGVTVALPPAVPIALPAVAPANPAPTARVPLTPAPAIPAPTAPVALPPVPATPAAAPTEVIAPPAIVEVTPEVTMPQAATVVETLEAIPPTVDAATVTATATAGDVGVTAPPAAAEVTPRITAEGTMPHAGTVAATLEAIPRTVDTVTPSAAVGQATPAETATTTLLPVPEADTRATAVPTAWMDDAPQAEATRGPGGAHRGRRILPHRLLRPFGGRQHGSTGHPDALTRVLQDAASAAGVLSLHDRQMPGRRSRIAHLAIGGAGVYVIDLLPAKNKVIEVRPTDQLAPDAQELVVGGKVMTAALTANSGRVALVRALLDEVELPTVQVVGAVCFVDASMPDSTSWLAVDGALVLTTSGLKELVSCEGALDPEHRATLHEYLTDRLPAAQ